MAEQELERLHLLVNILPLKEKRKRRKQLNTVILSRAYAPTTNVTKFSKQLFKFHFADMYYLPLLVISFVKKKKWIMASFVIE